MDPKLKLILKKEINKVIAEKYLEEFVLPSDGLYLIEIIASAKSWWQNLKNGRAFFKDDDVFFVLDRMEITTAVSEDIDARSAWNGNDLKGLYKTVLFAINLKAGKHTLNFIPDQSPYLKCITVSQVLDKERITYIPTDNNPAQKADGRPWISFVLINIAMNKILISATVNKDKQDDDDIKLILNGEIQKNKNNKDHKDWFWCGKTQKGNESSFEKVIDSKRGQNSIDLYADNTPFLHKIEIGLAVPIVPKRIPTENDPEWTGDFADDSDEILLARLIFGEASGEPYEAKVWVAWSVINRTEAKSWWPDTIHGAILQAGQYDPFKSLDKNFKKIINPLGYAGVKDADKKSWHECYKVSREVVARRAISPTRATHFNGKNVTRKWFEKNIVPNGKFLKKIGNTYFYWSPN